jgi:hypothetical protein
MRHARVIGARPCRSNRIATRIGIGSLCFGCVAVGLALAASAAPAHSAPWACQPSSLSAGFGGQDATQAIVGALTVTDTGTTACRVTGRPTIAMQIGASTRTLRELSWRSSAFPGTHFSSSVLLRPHYSASVRTRWMNWCDPSGAQRKRPSRVVATITPAPRPISTTVTGGLRELRLPDCVAPGRPSTIEVTLWTTPTPPPAGGLPAGSYGPLQSGTVTGQAPG